MKKKKISDIVIKIIIILVVILLVVTLLKTFWNLIGNSGNKTTRESVSMTEVDKLMSRNLDSKYPETPTAVVKMYCAITKELHGSHEEDLTEEQIEKLYEQLRKLFDDELLRNNDKDQHLKKLKSELEQYKKQKMIITRYTVVDPKEVKIYGDKDGNDCTKIPIGYSIKKGSNWLKQNEQVILRKDNNGRWKILGNELLEATKQDDEE